MSPEITLMISLVALIMSLFVFFAQMRLFKISDTLEEILAELRNQATAARSTPKASQPPISTRPVEQSAPPPIDQEAIASIEREMKHRQALDPFPDIRPHDAIELDCPGCTQHLWTIPQLGGMEGTCPNCGVKFVFPKSGI